MVEDTRRNKLNRLPILQDEDSLGRFPKWLHRKIPKGGELYQTGQIVKKYQLNTVCEEAKCPNRFECYSKQTATFLALGNACTRACGFCDIDFSKNPLPPDPDEPNRIALSSKELGLRHVVITMVARDDLPDQGASHIAEIIRAVRRELPLSTVEVLTSDFSGDFSALEMVLKENPEVFNHNIETVRRLTPKIRHKATFDRTLEVLSHAKKFLPSTSYVKSGIMVGLGEETHEVEETLKELADVGCNIITIGHYLQASRNKLPVKAFIPPEIFSHYEKFGKELGVSHIYSAPFVRSSYNADLFVEKKRES